MREELAARKVYINYLNTIASQLHFLVAWVMYNIWLASKTIVPDKRGYSHNIFLFLHKNMLWVLIRSALTRFSLKKAPYGVMKTW